MYKAIALLILIFALTMICNGQPKENLEDFTVDIYEFRNIDATKIPPEVKLAIVSCRSHCAYTFMSANVMPVQAIEVCNVLCLGEVMKDGIEEFVVLYEKPVPITASTY